MSNLTKLIPNELPTLMGPISIKDDIKPDEGIFGQSVFKERIIRLQTEGVAEVTQLQTAGHELFHTILWDTGMANKLPKDTQEALCDAMGAWFARAVMDKKLVILK